ncbi:MAG: tetratricopeptide repeat protein [Anaerolineae bacterium]|nr:tetratricopeptide repeat protein [Anaerolineae bacterium]
MLDRLSKRRIFVLIVLPSIVIVGVISLVFPDVALAQDPDVIELRQQVLSLEQDISWLQKIAGVVAGIFVVLQVYFESERRQGATVNNEVMETVGKLLAFDAERAKKLDDDEKTIRKQLDRLERHNPEQRIQAVLNDVNVLRVKVTRRNLHELRHEIVERDQEIKYATRFFDATNLDTNPGVYYVRGLAALLEGRITEAQKHFRQTLEQTNNTDWPDKFTRPMTLYFLGVLYKNQKLYDDENDQNLGAIPHFERALSAFRIAKKEAPQRDDKEWKVEIRAEVELAEVKALRSDYDLSQQTETIQPLIDALTELYRQDTRDPKIQETLERLSLIMGNYAFKNGNWKTSIACFRDGYTVTVDKRELSHMPTHPMAFLSLGIALLRNNGNTIATTQKEMNALDKAYTDITKIGRALHVTHAEARGRILYTGAAIIAARLLNNGRDISALDLNLHSEIADFNRVIAGVTYYIFSPLTKQMVDLDEFQKQVANPSEYLKPIFTKDGSNREVDDAAAED